MENQPYDISESSDSHTITKNLLWLPPGRPRSLGNMRCPAGAFRGTSGGPGGLLFLPSNLSALRWNSWHYGLAQVLGRIGFLGPSPLTPRPPLHLCPLHTGNQDNNFRIHVSSGLLMRGPRALDRERNSSHVLLVEAYNHDLGPMRSSVRVSGFRVSSLYVRLGMLGTVTVQTPPRPAFSMSYFLKPLSRPGMGTIALLPV